MSVFLENGVIPNSTILKTATAPGAKFWYLTKLLDEKNAGIFSIAIDEAYRSNAKQLTLTQYEAESKTQSLTNLYLASLIGPQKAVYQEKADSTWEVKEKLAYMRARNDQLRRQQVPAQMALGFRFEHGLGVHEDCNAAVLYYEQPARATVEYIERTFGMDSIEKTKLNLMGPYSIDKHM